MTVKQEYPRPQFVRKPWQCLNGMWDFSFDDTNAGIREKWYEAGRKLEKKICVPFVYQCEKAVLGIHRYMKFSGIRRDSHWEKTLRTGKYFCISRQWTMKLRCI